MDIFIKRIIFSIAFFLLSAPLLFSQTGGLDNMNPPEDFIDVVPENEIKTGHTKWLKKYYPSCMIGDSLNVNCTLIKQAQTITINHTDRMENLSWVKYFTGVKNIQAKFNFISILPDTFPSSLRELDLTYNNITIAGIDDFGYLPEKLKVLNISNQKTGIVSLPGLPDSLQVLIAASNKITTLPATLPENLKQLHLQYNKISATADIFADSKIETLNLSYNLLTIFPSDLPASLKVLSLEGNAIAITEAESVVLPDSLTSLNISWNKMEYLPVTGSRLKTLYAHSNLIKGAVTLPSGIETAILSANKIESFTALPPGLISLTASENLLTALPALPAAMTSLSVDKNLLTTIPLLPSTLVELNASWNQLAALPALPSSLKTLKMNRNNLSGVLQNLPEGLLVLECSHNNYSSLVIPSALTSLIITSNNLNTLPFTTFPASLNVLYCDSNNIQSLPELPNTLQYLRVAGNQVRCLPNLPKNLYEVDLSLVCGMNCWKGNVNNFKWNNAANWSEHIVPGAGDDVVILNGFVQLDGENISIRNLDVRNSYIYSPGKLSLSGDLSRTTTSLYCTLVFNGTQKQEFENLGSANLTSNVIINNTAGVSLVNYLNSIDTLTVTKGFIDLNNTSINVNRLGISHNGTIVQNGTLKYRIFLTPGWTFIGTPMKGQKLSDLDVNVKLGFGGSKQSIYSYDGTLSNSIGWVAPSGLVSDFTPGTGYRVYNHTSVVHHFDGVPFSGDKDFGVTYNTQGFDGGGWNFVANPYISAIDWANAGGWSKTKIDNAVYVWNHSLGKYSAWVNGADQNGGSRFIAAGQGFFVKANGEAPSLIIKENAKSPIHAPFMRMAASSTMLRVFMNDVQQSSDELLIRIHEGSTVDFDSEFDALKKLGFGHNLFTKDPHGKPLAISSIPAAEGSIPLMISSEKTGSFKFTFNGINELNKEVYLKDNQTGAFILLTDYAEYDFTLQALEDNSRFELVFNNIVTDLGNAGNSIATLVYPNPTHEEVTIAFSKHENATISVYNSLGGLVATHHVAGKPLVTLPVSGEKGVYTIKIKVLDKLEVFKIVKL